MSGNGMVREIAGIIFRRSGFVSLYESLFIDCFLISKIQIVTLLASSSIG